MVFSVTDVVSNEDKNKKTLRKVMYLKLQSKDSNSQHEYYEVPSYSAVLELLS